MPLSCFDGQWMRGNAHLAWSMPSLDLFNLNETNFSHCVSNCFFPMLVTDLNYMKSVEGKKHHPAEFGFFYLAKHPGARTVAHLLMSAGFGPGNQTFKALYSTSNMFRPAETARVHDLTWPRPHGLCIPAPARIAAACPQVSLQAVRARVWAEQWMNIMHHIMLVQGCKNSMIKYKVGPRLLFCCPECLFEFCACVTASMGAFVLETKYIRPFGSICLPEVLIP